MKKVTTEFELKEALKSGETMIVCVGGLAEEMRRKRTTKNTLTAAGVGLGLLGLLAAPLTGGTSLAATVFGLSATIGGSVITITTAELAILVGGSLAAYGIYNNYDIEFKPDGTVIIKAKT